jgi:cytochrome c-type biogenesis protein CcmH
LQRRLLDEVATSDHNPGLGTTRVAARLPWRCSCIIPLAAAAGYTLLGSPRALDPLQRQARLAPQQIAEMVAGLVEKLRKNPDDSQGWVMLARSYKVMERFPEAAEAYSRAGTLVDQDAALLADYADVLSRSHGGSLQGKPIELVERALRIDPDEPQALLLAGAAASDRQQFAAAADLLGTPARPTRARLRRSARARGGDSQGARDSPPAQAAATNPARNRLPAPAPSVAK